MDCANTQRANSSFCVAVKIRFLMSISQYNVVILLISFKNVPLFGLVSSDQSENKVSRLIKCHQVYSLNCQNNTQSLLKDFHFCL